MTYFKYLVQQVEECFLLVTSVFTIAVLITFSVNIISIF